jgi:hypothetical protein
MYLLLPILISLSFSDLYMFGNFSNDLHRFSSLLDQQLVRDSSLQGLPLAHHDSDVDQDHQARGAAPYKIGIWFEIPICKAFRLLVALSIKPGAQRPTRLAPGLRFQSARPAVCL